MNASRIPDSTRGPVGANVDTHDGRKNIHFDFDPNATKNRDKRRLRGAYYLNRDGGPVSSDDTPSSHHSSDSIPNVSRASTPEALRQATFINKAQERWNNIPEETKDPSDWRRIRRRL